MRILVAEKLAPEGVALLREEHEVDVRVVFTKPNGREESIPAFCMQEYERRSLAGGRRGAATWL